MSATLNFERMIAIDIEGVLKRDEGLRQLYLQSPHFNKVCQVMRGQSLTEREVLLLFSTLCECIKAQSAELIKVIQNQPRTIIIENG